MELTSQVSASHNECMRRGQALVMVLLLLSVVITVGLAISSRSVTEVGISTTQEESARALAAAEAGIEAALSGSVTGGGPSVPVGTTGSYIVATPSQYEGGNQVTFAQGLHSGEVATLFLQVGDQKYIASSVIVCWGESGSSSPTPALEAITYYQSNGNYLTSRSVYDPQSGRTPGAASPDTATSSGCPTDKSYAYRTTVNLGSSAPNYLRLKLAYNGDTSSPVGVVRTGSGQFPAQGQLVTSTGQAGQTSRKVQVVQRYADLLPYLDNAVFSGGSLTK